MRYTSSNNLAVPVYLIVTAIYGSITHLLVKMVALENIQKRQKIFGCVC
jgi:hypothetical protein